MNRPIPRSPLAPLFLALAALAAAASRPRWRAPPTRRRSSSARPCRSPAPRRAIGGFFKEGYELAFEQVNKNGGLEVGGKKLPVQLKLLDDTSTQATAVSLADRLVNSDKVDFLLGTYSSHLVEAQSTVARAEQASRT